METTADSARPGPRGAPSARSRVRALVVCASLALLLCAGATAQAQEDPYATVEEQAETSQLDTDLTPVAKDTDLWTLVHGAPYPKTQTVPESVTSFDDELVTVSFRNRTIGLAGGSGCELTPVQEPREPDADFGARASECEGTDGSRVDRVPVLYRYSEPLDADPSWDELELPGGDDPGYIGAIAWIDSSRALIVGGTGTYPGRELGPADQDEYGRSNAVADPTDPAKADPAGRARAWLYDRRADEVSELDLASLTAGEPGRAGMRGLSAAACFSDPTPGMLFTQSGRDPDPKPDIELCFAGGLGQLWEWREGGFNGARIDSQAAESELSNSRLFDYRVRDLEFMAVEPPTAVAVTAGCCSANELENTPRVLLYNGDTKFSRQGYITPEYKPGDPRWFAYTLTDRLPSTVRENGTVKATEPDRNAVNANPELPDSYYSLTASGGNSNRFDISVVASPGGPAPAAGSERPSLISQPYVQSVKPPGNASFTAPADPAVELLHTQLSTARLLAGDGDSDFPDTRRQATLVKGGIPDWVVGELRSSQRPGVGAQGLVVATALEPTLEQSLNIGLGFPVRVNECQGLTPCRPTPDEALNGWEPVDQGKAEAHLRSRFFLLPSYTTNAVEIVGDEEDGWAVGEHGAILRLATDKLQGAAAASEPKPPRLGAARPSALSDRDAYDGVSPSPAHSAGIVPEHGDETVGLDRPEMVPVGTAPPGQIVMSRDGSEGWAVGGNTFTNGLNVAGNTFTYFDGTRWSSCDPVGVEGVSPADPACEGLAGLRRWRDSSGALGSSEVTHVARVPLEDDSDPTNDDELELVAIGSAYAGPEYEGEKLATFIRYRDGRWFFEDAEAAATIPEGVQKMAFTGADEGWLTERTRDSTGNEWLYRFDGETWTRCAPGSGACEDPAGRLPRCIGEISGLAAVGSRAYLYGQRILGDATSCDGAVSTTIDTTGRNVPLVLYHDRGGVWTDGSGQGEDGAGFDPGFSNPGTDAAGSIDVLSVVEGREGHEGWAVGSFSPAAEVAAIAGAARVPPPEDALLRLDPAAGWRSFDAPGPVEDYLLPGPLGTSKPPARFALTYPSASGPGATFIGQETCCLGTRGGRTFAFDGERERFELVRSRRPQAALNLNALMGEAHPYGEIRSMAPDGDGGFWASIGGHLFHYTDEAPVALFREVPNPLGARGAGLRDLTHAPDGSVWAASDSNRLYRHDPIAGWEEARVSGWDPGRVVTRASAAEAIAFGPDGEGLLVGEGGRIANLSAQRVSLDPAAGRSCALGDAIPCGSSRDLSTVDIAPDGSALAAGERLALLWRPPGGDFRTIAAPPIGSSTRIEAISYPSPDRAYLATDRGLVFRGEMSAPGAWRWRAENLAADGEVVGSGAALRDVAVDGSGHGYAVGDGATILERGGEGEWHAVAAPGNLAERLTEVELAPGGGAGVLIGGDHGLVLAGAGSRLHLARPNDFAGTSALTGRVVGLAYLAGATEGSVDAWAGLAAAGQSGPRVLRYRSEGVGSGEDPAAAGALADAPRVSDTELSLGAFGKSDCDELEESLCPEMSATTTTNEVVGERIAEELGERREEGGLDLAILTGDATDSASRPAASLADLEKSGIGNSQLVSNPTREAGPLKHRRYGELVVDELEDRRLPLLGALGSQDLTETFACDTEGRCHTTKEFANAGENFAWREAFAGEAGPWGDGSSALDTQSEGDLAFEPAPGSEDNSLRIEDQRADLDGEGAAPEAKAEIGGASTHYAVDAIRDGEAIARIVFVDTSLRSLQASDPLQQPHELAGGQQRFLERMICTEGQSSTFGDGCTRGKDQRAIVVSNTPTYSYGPGALTHTALDGTTFEATMLRYDVDLVISGALGYNGLYYTLAPGVHEPCPAGSYPQSPPSGNTPDCLAGPAGPAEEAQKRVAESPAGEHSPGQLSDPTSLISGQSLSGAYPTLIASGAGGKFGPDGNEPADGPAGQWHGYSIARLLEGGDIVIEQRPIFDWIGIDAPDHSVAPKSRLKLSGYGRSPISTTTEGQRARAFHYEIFTPAITHRYDLLLADPEEPWLPCQEADVNCRELHANLSKPSSEAETAPSATGEDNPCSPYLCLPSRIGVVDDQSGQVRAGDGRYPETFAVAMLSVDDELATYPLVFKRSPSFVATPALRSGALPNTAGTRPTAPPLPPPPPGLPQIPQVDIPQIPPPPGIPQLTAATPPELQPPAPPAPPPPTQQPAPLDLSVAPPGVSISTPTALIQPPTPPVNPAPPGGARREARQRQAAAQKGGADSDAESGESESGGSDATDSRTVPATRRDRTRPEPSFTALAAPEQPSAWTRGALYGGGITMAALILAMGFSVLRPTPRRRAPELPAPSWARRGR